MHYILPRIIDSTFIVVYGPQNCCLAPIHCLLPHPHIWLQPTTRVCHPYFRQELSQFQFLRNPFIVNSVDTMFQALTIRSHI